MHDPATEAPTEALIDHIRVRYHETHRRELPDLIALARTVEAAHATDPNTPHGLAQALEAMIADLDAHMRREETGLFSAFEAGSPVQAAGSIAGLRDDHAGQEAALNRIVANHARLRPMPAGPGASSMPVSASWSTISTSTCISKIRCCSRAWRRTHDRGRQIMPRLPAWRPKWTPRISIRTGPIPNGRATCRAGAGPGWPA